MVSNKSRATFFVRVAVPHVHSFCHNSAKVSFAVDPIEATSSLRVQGCEVLERACATIEGLDRRPIDQIVRTLKDVWIAREASYYHLQDKWAYIATNAQARLLDCRARLRWGDLALPHNGDFVSPVKISSAGEVDRSDSSCCRHYCVS